MLAKSSDSDDENDNEDLSDFDDGASLNSTNLDKNFRGAMKNMLYGVNLPGMKVVKGVKAGMANKLKNLPKNIGIGGEGLVQLQINKENFENEFQETLENFASNMVFLEG